MTAPALTQAETSETYVSDEAARAEYIAAARSAAWRRRLCRRSGDFAPLPLGARRHRPPHQAVHCPGADGGRGNALRQIRASDRQSRSDRHRSGRRIHHRQRGRDRDRHRLCLSAHRRRGVLPDRGDGSHHSGHGLRADPRAPAWQRAQRQSRDRRAHLLLPDPGQHDARLARRQPAANGADAHPFGLAERNFFKLRLKCSLPYLFAALKIAAATSVIGAIVGEWIGATTGIGALIIQATYNFDSPLLYATIVVGSAFRGVLRVISGLESHFLKWNVAQTELSKL